MLLLIIITLIVLFIASYSDIRTREIPDYLSYSFFAIVIGFSMISSIMDKDYTILIRSILGAAIGFTIGWGLFYLGQWGGGDAKLLLGMGGLIGFDIHNLLTEKLWAYLLLLFISGALYSLAWVILLFFKNRKSTMSAIKKKRSLIRKAELYLILPSGILLWASYYLGISYLAFIPLIFYFFIYLTFFIRSVEEVSFIKVIPVDELTEGDWVLSRFKGVKIDKYGIEKQDIEKLKERGIDKVKIKIGVPFIPSFLIGYILFLFL